jgi:hypothetical protein
VTAVVTVAAAWTFVPLVALAQRAAAHGGVFTGSDGIGVADQFQYMAWIREAGEHGLIANPFDLAPDRAVFLHPLFAPSGLLWRLGVGVEWTLLLWAPVALAALAGGYAAYVRTRIDGPPAARAPALAIALFYFAPAHLVADWTGALSPGATRELGRVAGALFPAGQLWGGLPFAIALGLMAFALLGAERLLEPKARAPGRRGRWYAAWTAAAGLLTSWVHPWQGATLLLVLVGLLAWTRPRRRAAALLGPIAATLAPLVYYFVLSRADAAWRTAQTQTELGHAPAWALALGAAPLLALAPWGLRGPVRDAGERILRLWAPAVLVAYLAIRSFPSHVLASASLPLAVLSVRGWRRLGAGRSAAAVAVVAITVPGMAYAADLLRDTVRRGTQPYVLAGGEARALRWLDRAPRAGGVLARVYLGAAVPAFAGRATWVGHPSWTPGFARRAADAEALFEGPTGRGPARALVRASGAAYVLADCGERRDLAALLGPAVGPPRRFGCAAIYPVRSG